MGKQEEKYFEMLFVQMVMSLNEVAMMQLGKTVNPATKQTEKNLEQAQGTIDLLRMLRVKTMNNLTAQEEQLLGEAILSLEMHFSYEKEKEAAKAPPAEENKQPPEADKEDAPSDDENDANESPGKRPGMNN
ncbi:DUF1844 domain-containing protein [candidate division FCPU426 bacterium]|nr:DUF1844 domain-containing protein [candidate division FCPU426 bacterium]